MNSNLQFAIIGCGRIARRHAAEAAKWGRLAAFCDPDRKKADELANQYQGRAFYDLDEMLSSMAGLDIVAVCSPNGLHATQSIKCLDSGVHVLCEKPMAIASADARKMIDAAERNNRKLNIVKQNRFNPPVSYVKRLLNDGKLGRILSFQVNCFWNRPPSYYRDHWHGTLQLDGGILYTQFSHFVDILYWYLGDLVSVMGSRSNLLHQGITEFEDCGVAMLQLKDNVLGSFNYSINAFAENFEGSFTLFGEKGTVKIGGQYLNELEYFRVDGEEAPLLARGQGANDYGLYRGSMSNHDKVYEAFVASIKDPSTALASANETMKTVEIIERIYAASPLLSRLPIIAPA